ncbi:glycosyltransferase family 87 protein [Sphingomonas hankyongi]|uniref:DUF2029 domain-containing protein n=1 Tax=Sphingomonas hankyongi TaxID=2908209 RepID=A0ABT0S2S8_9SPHN|nr:glycosyltransferase family 87 protein [Sphingomonas hankyongi]MCL6730179.1 DUF2029 domain-containing protein [Sphingomonas hankyongi]
MRAAAVAWSVIFALLAIAASLSIYTLHNPIDFLSFWAAGRLSVEGTPALSYDLASHRALETSVVAMEGVLPFPYPPPFLLIVAPFGFLAFAPSFTLWVGLTFGTFIGSAILAGGRRGCAFAASHPAIAANSLIGQNGFLTSSILFAGTALIRRKPKTAGAVLGFLVVKPQLAILVPIALLAGRHWKAAFSGAASAVCLLALAAVVLGFDTYRGFLSIIPIYLSYLGDSRWPWNELASPYAAMRSIGIDQRIALALHTIVAVCAAALVWRAWEKGSSNRAAILAAAALLIPPYIFTYDSLFLALPMMTLASDRAHPMTLAGIWVLCFLPITTYFGWYSGPNTVPLAAIVCLVLLVHSDPKITEAGVQK